MRALKRIFFVGLVALVTPCFSAYATNFNTFKDGVRFGIASNLDEPFTLSSTGFSVDAQTLTGGIFDNSPEPPYSVHFWVTFGEANNGDVPRQSRFPGFIVPEPGDPEPVVTTELSTTFRLPVRGNPNPPNELEPGLTAANMVGGSLFFTVCLDTAFASTPSPSDGVCVSDEVVVHPNQPTFVASPPLSQANQATLYWETLPRDNNVPIGNSHRITLLSQSEDTNDPNNSVVLTINDRTNVGNFEGSLRNRLFLTDSPLGLPGFVAKPGVAYQASVQACAGFDVCGEARTIENVTRFADSFSASSNRTDAIEVSWVKHATNTPSYRLTRCEVQSGVCTNITPGSNAVSYIDDDAVPGQSYRYTVLACPSTGPCDGNLIPTGISNAGVRAFALPNPATVVDASDGIQRDRISVNWSEFTPAASNFNDPGYRIVVSNSFSPDFSVIRDVLFQDGISFTFDTGSGRPLPSGVELTFNVLTCTNIRSDSPTCVAAESADTGYSRTLFDAGSPSEGVAKIIWKRFSQDTTRYRLQRCTVSPQQCAFVGNDVGNVVSFNDTDVDIGTSYTYSVHACSTNQNSSCVEIGETGIVTVVGKVLPDKFEIDNSPDLLINTNQIIRESVSQSRTFHEIADQDWVKVELRSGLRQLEVRTTSEAEGVNTQISLFNSSGQLLACALNTPGVITGHARLRLPDLPPGDYFLRVEQEDEQQVLGPVENYFLTTTISVASTGAAIEFNGNCNSIVADFPSSAKGTNVVPILQIILSE